VKQKPKARWVWVLAWVLGVAFHLPLVPWKLPNQSANVEVVADDLIQQAQQAIKDPNHSQLDYGEFFLRTETAKDPQKRAQLLGEWQRLIEEINEQEVLPTGRTIRFEANVQRVILRLFSDANLGSYHREHSELQGYFRTEAPGGNCEAQTKMTIGVFANIKAGIPASHQLGVQIYTDHIQTVIINKRTNRVWELLTGKKQEYIESDIYHPVILVHAWLKGIGIKPKRPASDFLLFRGVAARGKKRGGGSGFETDTTLKFPHASARFQENIPPLHAQLAMPFLEPERNHVEPAKTNQITTRDQFLAAHPAMYLYGMDSIDSPFGIAQSKLVFRTEKDAHYYVQLKTNSQRRDFLLKTMARKMEKLFADSSLRAVNDMLTNPWLFAQTNTQQLRTRFQAILDVERLMYMMEYVARELYLDHRSGNGITKALEVQVPELHKMLKSSKYLAHWGAQSPEKFLDLMDRMTVNQRTASLKFLALHITPHQAQQIAKVLGDPQLKLLDPPAIEIPDPQVKNWVFVELEPLVSGSMNKAPPTPPKPPPTLKNLELGSYIDLVLSGIIDPDTKAGKLVLKKWGERASDELMRRMQRHPKESCVQLDPHQEQFLHYLFRNKHGTLLRGMIQHHCRQPSKQPNL
jgi:hypothetical protein